MKTNYLFFLLIFFVSGTVHAQPEWIVYNPSNSGLPSWQVYSITIDANDMKWIGGGGLTKFDGNTWVTYNGGAGAGPTVPQVRSIAIDNNDIKWVASDFEMCAAGLDKFDGVDWTNYIYGCPEVRSIAVDASNNKWFATRNEGLWKFDDVNWTYYNTSNSGIPSDYLSYIAIDNNDNKWMGNNGLAKFDGVNWTVYDTSNSGLPHNFVQTITIDINDDLWIGTRYNGLAKFDGTNWTVYDTTNSGLPDDRITSIAIDLNGDKWIGTWYGGLAKFDGVNWTVYDTSNSLLPHNYIYALAIDGYGNKWIATWQGLAVFKEGGVVIGDTAEDLPEYEGVLLYPNPTNGQLWISTGTKQPVSVYIYGVTGSLIQQITITDEQETIDISSYRKGIYPVKIIMGEEIFVHKIIRQ